MLSSFLISTQQGLYNMETKFYLNYLVINNISGIQDGFTFAVPESVFFFKKTKNVIPTIHLIIIEKYTEK